MKRFTPSTARRLDPLIGDLVAERFAFALRPQTWWPRAAPTASQSIVSVLERHLPQHAIALEQQVRRAGELALPAPKKGQWDYLQSLRRTASEVLANDPETAFVLMSIYDGRIREAAVRAAPQPVHGFCLALFILRLNDWTKEVRSAASARLHSFGDSLSNEAIVECADLIWQFDRLGRATVVDRALLASLLERDEVVARLKATVLAGAGDEALRVFQRLVRTPALDDSLVKAAKTNRHPGIRAAAASAIFSGAVAWRETRRAVTISVDRQDVARALLKDRAISVQLEALRFIATCDALSPEDERLFLQHALSRHRSVADFARWRLRSANVDWVATARAKYLNDGGTPQLANALGEFGTSEDGALLAQTAARMPDALSVPYLAGAARQDIGDAVKRLQHIALTDANHVVARRAAHALKEAGRILDSSDLKGAASQPDFFKRGLGGHLAAQGASTLLNVIARLEAARTEFDTRFWFQKALRKINHAPYKPTDDENAELVRLLSRAPQIAGLARHMGLATQEHP